MCLTPTGKRPSLCTCLLFPPTRPPLRGRLRQHKPRISTKQRDVRASPFAGTTSRMSPRPHRAPFPLIRNTHHPPLRACLRGLPVTVAAGAASPANSQKTTTGTGHTPTLSAAGVGPCAVAYSGAAQRNRRRRRAGRAAARAYCRAFVPRIRGNDCGGAQ